MIAKVEGEKTPLVSVLMPVFNAEKYLDEAIQSVLNQTYQNFEFLIINDGSSDKSASIIKAFAKQDARIKFFDQGNKGLIATLNFGLSVASGEYIARFDSDDICLPERLKLQVNFLNENKQISAVGTGVSLIDDQGCEIGSGPFSKMKYTHQEIDRSHLKGYGGNIIHPSAMYRKNIALDLEGYSHHYPCAEDFDFWLRFAEVGKLANLPQVLLLYRQHIDSIGYRNRKLQISSTKKALESAFKRRGIELVPALSIDEPIPNQSDIMTKWAWWAIKSNQNKTAFKYAKKLFYKKPWNVELWKIVYVLTKRIVVFNKNK